MSQASWSAVFVFYVVKMIIERLKGLSSGNYDEVCLHLNRIYDPALPASLSPYPPQSPYLWHLDERDMLQTPFILC